MLALLPPPADGARALALALLEFPAVRPLVPAHTAGVTSSPIVPVCLARDARIVFRFLLVVIARVAVSVWLDRRAARGLRPPAHTPAGTGTARTAVVYVDFLAIPRAVHS